MITFHHGSNTIQQSVKNYFFSVQFIRTPREHYFLNFFINIPFCSQIETNNRCFTYVSKEGILQLSTLANYLYNFFSIHFRHFWSVVFADDFWRLSIKWAEWQVSARNQKSKGFLKDVTFLISFVFFSPQFVKLGFN